MESDSRSPTRMNERYEPSSDLEIDCRNRAGRQDGIWNWDLMYIRIGRGILRFLLLHIKIWRLEGLL